MAHRIDWDNIHLHIHDNDVRYKRRLLRKHRFSDSSYTVTTVSPAAASLKKLKSVKDQNFKSNNELVVACPNVGSDEKPISVDFGGETNDKDLDVENFEEGLREGGKSLVCYDNASDDFSLKKLEDVQDRKFLCNDVDPDLGVFEEGLGEGGKSLVCYVQENVSGNVSLKKLENFQDENFLCDDVGPDLGVFEEDLREDGKSLVCKVNDDASDDVDLKKLENVEDRKYICNDADPGLGVCEEGLGGDGKSLVCNVNDDASVDVGLKKLENVQDQKYLCNDADPDLGVFEEGLREDGKPLVCQVEDNTSNDSSLKKLENVEDQQFLSYDVSPDLEMFEEGLREGGKSKVDGNIYDVGLKKLENFKNPEFLCNDLYPQLDMFKEGLREGNKSLVCVVDDSAFDDVCLKKHENVQDRIFLCSDLFPELEMSKEGLWEGGKPLVCKVKDSATDDVSSKKLENVQEQKFLCNDVDPDLEIFKEGLREGGKSLVCSVEDYDSFDSSLKKLKNVQDKKYLWNNLSPGLEMFEEGLGEGGKKLVCKVDDNVDPDYKKFLECMKVDGQLFALKVKKNDGSVSYLMYEKDAFHKEYQRKLKGDNVKFVLEKQKGDTANFLRKNARKEKREKVVPRREGFSGNSNKSPGTNRSSVVKRRDNMEIISIEKPIEMEEVLITNNYRRCKTIRNKRQRPLNLDDGHNIDHLRKSKKKNEKVERRPCLTRIDHVSGLMDIAGKSKGHYRRTSPRSERRDLMVQQGEDIENSRFSSGTGNMDVVVKEEKFDDSRNAVVKRRQIIQGRDSGNDNNKRPRYKYDKKFGKYAEVKELKSNRLNYVEEDTENSSDLEILDPDNQQNLKKFEVMKVFNASVIEDYPLSMERPSDYENSEFREELMDILRRPFNLEEYKSLMQQAKYRHLMGGPEYSDGLKGKEVSNTYGKSPLDYHPDVQKRLRQCRRISRRLNILRGFIYWYGRACQIGAFKPWLDKSCAAVTPNPL
ncbi:hypothetical protein AgCh_008356 [Apium graveolens]